MEIDGFMSADAEVLPVNGGVLGALPDIGNIACLMNSGLSCRYCAACGRSKGEWAGERKKGGAERAEFAGKSWGLFFRRSFCVCLC